MSEQHAAGQLEPGPEQLHSGPRQGIAPEA